MLAAHLTPENHLELLDRARHKSKREIEEFLANRAPKPEVRAAVWKLPRTRDAVELRNRSAEGPDESQFRVAARMAQGTPDGMLPSFTLGSSASCPPPQVSRGLLNLHLAGGLFGGLTRPGTATGRYDVRSSSSCRPLCGTGS